MEEENFSSLRHAKLSKKAYGISGMVNEEMPYGRGDLGMTMTFLMLTRVKMVMDFLTYQFSGRGRKRSGLADGSEGQLVEGLVLRGG